MQVSLKQSDVEQAIALYLKSMGVTATVSNVSFKAGRKGAGLTTLVDLVDTQHAPIPEQAEPEYLAELHTHSEGTEESEPQVDSSGSLFS